VPASLSVKSNLNQFPYKLIDPALTLDESKKWDKVWNEMFVNQGSAP